MHACASAWMDAGATWTTCWHCRLRLIERLWRSLKYESVYLQDIADGFAAQRVIDEWIHFYNREPPHSALGKATPDEAYGGTNELRKAA